MSSTAQGSTDGWRGRACGPASCRATGDRREPNGAPPLGQPPPQEDDQGKQAGVGWGQGGWAGGPGSRCEARVQPPRGPGSRPVRGRFPAHLPQPLSQPLETETSFRCQKEPSPTGPPRVLPSPGWPCSPCGSGRKEGRGPGRQWPSSPLGAWLAPLACACGSFWLLPPPHTSRPPFLPPGVPGGHSPL